MSIGIPIHVAAGSDSDSWERPSTVEAEVDYVRIYQPIKSIPLAEEAVWECASARNDVMLDLLEGVNVCVMGMIVD